MTTDHFITSPCGAFDLVEQHGDFNPESYRNNFAFYLFTYLRGFRELVDNLLLDERFHCVELAEGYVRAERVSIGELIEDQWRRMLPKKADWSHCHGNQIDRIFEGKPMRIDRGLQAMLALQVVFSKSDEQKLRDFNVFEFVRMVPAIYALKDLEPAAQAWLRGGAIDKTGRASFNEFIAKLCPNHAEAKGGQVTRAKIFLSDVAAGHALTFDNAAMILELVRRYDTSARITTLSSRMEGGRRSKLEKRTQMRCCDNEAEFIRLSPAAIDRMNAILPHGKRDQSGR